MPPAKTKARAKKNDLADLKLVDFDAWAEGFKILSRRPSLLACFERWMDSTAELNTATAALRRARARKM